MMMPTISRTLAIVIAIPLLTILARVSAQEQIVPGETYTADLIGPWVLDSYAQRQAQGGGQGPPAGGELLEVPLYIGTQVPPGETIPQSAGELTGFPPTLRSGFEGVRRGVDTAYEPPDTMGAIGPEYFMEVVNGNVSIFQKSDGGRIASESLESFFSGIGLSGLIGDPRVVFDQHSGRWIVIATNFYSGPNPGRIALAVSLSPNPMEDFFKTSFLAASSDASAWPDYPTLGVDVNGIYIGALIVKPNGIADSMTIWAIDKSPLIVNPPSIPSMVTVTAWRGLELSLDDSGNVSGIGNQPAHTYGTPGTEYIIGKSTPSALRIYGIDPPLTLPTMRTAIVPVTEFSRPPLAPALGSTFPISPVDDRLMMSVFRDGSLWTTHCIDVNGRAGVRWYQINPTSRTVIQSGTVADPSLHFYFPSLMVNSTGHVAMGFSGSDADHYVSAYYTGRRASDAPGDMAVPQLLKNGEAPYQVSDVYNRWGDYSYTTLDPVDQSTFWTIQEYAETPTQDTGVWGTWVGVLSYFVPCSVPEDCDDANECIIDDCVDGFCENNPQPIGTPCSGGLCCYGSCTPVVCSFDPDCDDANQCTVVDTCVNPDTCYAHCNYTWPACDPVTRDGCCGPTCTSANDFDCHCGDGGCSQGEDQSNCPVDCGCSVASEVLGSTCRDGLDNDCDGYIDCLDVADCSFDPACNCYDNNGNGPLVCVNWVGGFPPQRDQDFTITVPDSNNPDPDVTFRTGNNGWRVWSQASRTNDAPPANLGNVRIDPTLDTANFGLTIAHGASHGAAKVASIALVKEGWTGRSNLSGGSIAGDLEGDLVLQESGGHGGAISFTIGGNVNGVMTIPKVGVLEVKGNVSESSVITIRGFSGVAQAKFNTNSGSTFAGDLFLPNGLPWYAQATIGGSLTDSALVDFNGQDGQEELAGTLEFRGGSAEHSVISVGRLTWHINLARRVYFGTANFTSIERFGVITAPGATLDGRIHVLEDWKGSLTLNPGIFGPEGVILIDGSLTQSGNLYFAPQPGGITGGTLHIIQDCEGSIVVAGDMDGDILVDGTITSSGYVLVSGQFNGNLCAANVFATAQLPGNIHITEFGPNAKVCGQLVCGQAVASEPGGVNKNRALSFSVPPSSPAMSIQTAIRLKLVDLQNPDPPNQYPPPDFHLYEFATCNNGPSPGTGESVPPNASGQGGCARWVGKPGTFYEAQDPPQALPYHASRLQCTPYYHDWSTEGLFHVIGAEIVPSSTYELEVVPRVGGICSASLTISTARYGDIYHDPPSDNKVDALDIVQAINAVKQLLGAPGKAIAQLQPNLPELNTDLNILDISAVVDALKGLAYPFSGPCPCPSTVICNATSCSSPDVCGGGLCVKTCVGGANAGLSCINNTHCPSGACGDPYLASQTKGYCRDRCGRCTP